jgi:protein phosphatase
VTSVPQAPEESSVSPLPTPAAPTVTALSPPPPQPGTDCRTPE